MIISRDEDYLIFIVEGHRKIGEILYSEYLRIYRSNRIIIDDKSYYMTDLVFRKTDLTKISIVKVRLQEEWEYKNAEIRR